ncbi:hypothetical protein NQ318_010013 [Aromia moschata]|uniref:C2H2-type domain-containing protein n=1 Tax=Aromia moschata TaxID=1265417 RepID=A0AAV8Y8T2_9CUCU|nr:hypothetical protein NQ318_010013 [Aromia moschata]
MMPSDEIELKHFVEKSCDRETNLRIIESDLYQDVKSAQNQETNVMGYHELEECLDIKSEGEVKKEEDECDGDISHDDTEIRPFVNNSCDQTNQTTIECVPCENASVTEMEYLMYSELIEGVEVITYFCKFCSYEAKLKEDLTKHVDHKVISALTYQCDLCPFKTKWKRYLSTHVRIHQEASETKWKGYLSTHVRIHQEASEITTYQCALCPYKTKWKKSLSMHLLIHQTASEVTTYQCDQCPYKTQRKRLLARHMLIHGNTTYQCKLCPYKTKRKDYLSSHSRVHLGRPFEFSCKFCSYTANRRQYNRYINI